MGFLDKITAVFGKKKIETTAELSAEDKASLLDKIRQSDLFKDLPEKNIEEIFALMETVNLEDGEVIIQEGDEGDYYYLLVRGTAQVFRRLNDDEEPKLVATLSEPTGFGEEALISNAKRNATITMTSSGAAMRLSKDAFNDFVKDPLLTWFSPLQAQEKVAKGAKWIDVRDPDDAKQAKLHGAINIPIAEIREKAAELDKDVLHICYCENGRLSSSAAFLLRQRGVNVGVLRGGLQSLKRAGIA